MQVNRHEGFEAGEHDVQSDIVLSKDNRRTRQVLAVKTETSLVILIVTSQKDAERQAVRGLVASGASESEPPEGLSVGRSGTGVSAEKKSSPGSAVPGDSTSGSGSAGKSGLSFGNGASSSSVLSGFSGWFSLCGFLWLLILSPYRFDSYAALSSLSNRCGSLVGPPAAP